MCVPPFTEMCQGQRSRSIFNATVLITPTPVMFSGSESEASVLRKCQMTKQLKADLLQAGDKDFASQRGCLVFN